MECRAYLSDQLHVFVTEVPNEHSHVCTRTAGCPVARRETAGRAAMHYAMCPCGTLRTPLSCVRASAPRRMPVVSHCRDIQALLGALPARVAARTGGAGFPFRIRLQCKRPQSSYLHRGNEWRPRPLRSSRRAHLRRMRHGCTLERWTLDLQLRAPQHSQPRAPQRACSCVRGRQFLAA